MRFSVHSGAKRDRRITRMLASGFAAFAVAMASAPGAQTSSPVTETVPAELQMPGDFIVAQTLGHVLASNLIGAGVLSADGETIGTVCDIILDRNRNLVGITVSVGGLLGIRDREIGIPVSAMGIGPNIQETDTTVVRNHSFNDPVSDVVLTLDSDAIEQASAFARLEDIPGLGRGPAVSPNATPAQDMQFD